MSTDSGIKLSLDVNLNKFVIFICNKRGVADSFAKWTTWKISDISDLFSPKFQVFSVFSDFSGFFRFFRFFRFFQVFFRFFSFFSFFQFFRLFQLLLFFLANKGKRLEESYFLFILSWTKLEIYDLLFHQNTIFFFSKSGFGRWRESARVQTYYLCLEGWSQLMALFRNIFLLQRLSIKLITAPMSS